jgi:hypothetical protein
MHDPIAPRRVASSLSRSHRIASGSATTSAVTTEQLKSRSSGQIRSGGVPRAADLREDARPGHRAVLVVVEPAEERRHQPGEPQLGAGGGEQLVQRHALHREARCGSGTNLLRDQTASTWFTTGTSAE